MNTRALIKELFDKICSLAEAKDEAGLRQLLESDQGLQVRYYHSHYYHTPISLLAFQGKHDAVKLLLDVGGEGLLNSAAYGYALRGDANHVEGLLTRGASINAALNGYITRHNPDENPNHEEKMDADEYDKLVEDLLNRGGSFCMAIQVYAKARLKNQVNRYTNLYNHDLMAYHAAFGHAESGEFKEFQSEREKIFDKNRHQFALPYALSGNFNEISREFKTERDKILNIDEKTSKVLNSIAVGAILTGKEKEFTAAGFSFNDQSHKLAQNFAGMVVGEMPDQHTLCVYHARNGNKAIAAKLAGNQHKNRLLMGYAQGRQQQLFIQLLNELGDHIEEKNREKILKQCLILEEYTLISKLIERFPELAKKLNDLKVNHSKAQEYRLILFIRSLDVRRMLINDMRSNDFAVRTNHWFADCNKFADILEDIIKAQEFKKFTYSQIIAWNHYDAQKILFQYPINKNCIDEIRKKWPYPLSEQEAAQLVDAAHNPTRRDLDELEDSIIKLEKTAELIKDTQTPEHSTLVNILSIVKPLNEKIKDCTVENDDPGTENPLRDDYLKAKSLMVEVNVAKIKEKAYCRVIIDIIQNSRLWRTRLDKYHHFEIRNFRYSPTLHNTKWGFSGYLSSPIGILMSEISKYSDWESSSTSRRDLRLALKRIMNRSYKPSDDCGFFGNPASWDDDNCLGLLHNIFKKWENCNVTRDKDFADRDFITLLTRMRSFQINAPEVHQRLRQLTGTYLPKFKENSKEYNLMLELLADLDNPEGKPTFDYLKSIKRFTTRLENEKIQSPKWLQFLKDVYNVLSVITVVPAITRVIYHKVTHDSFAFWRSNKEHLKVKVVDETRELQLQHSVFFGV